MLAVSAICLALLGVTTPQVVVEGNVVLPDEIYFSVIDLAGLTLDKRGTPYAAHLLAQEIEDFLVSAGYELAQVKGRAEDGKLILTIDEGRLARVIFRGRGDFRTVQLKLVIAIPYNVFNRPQLLRQLESLREDMGITDIQFELVEIEDVDHTGIQIEDFGEVPGVPLAKAPGKYELRVTLGKREWIAGWGIHLDLNQPDGIKTELSYAGINLLLDNDRWRASAGAGVNQYGNVTLPGNWVGLSRGVASLSYTTPPLFGDFRPSFLGYFDYQMRQRPDLLIQSYRFMQQGVLLQIGYDLTESIWLRLGAGFEGQIFFDIDQPINEPTLPRVQSYENLLGRVSLNSFLLFDPDNPRLDQRHELDLDVSVYFGSLRRPRVALAGRYQKYFRLGWHDLIVRARANGQWGSVRLPDEVSLGYYTRAVFGGRYWIRRAAGGSLEFRYSITRDLFKVGVFADNVVFEEPGRGTGPHELVYAAGVGPSVHILLFDIFQADFFYAVGISTQGLVEHGLSVGVSKAF